MRYFCLATGAMALCHVDELLWLILFFSFPTASSFFLSQMFAGNKNRREGKNM
jgi:hypothetical protein